MKPYGKKKNMPLYGEHCPCCGYDQLIKGRERQELKRELKNEIDDLYNIILENQKRMGHPKLIVDNNILEDETQFVGIVQIYKEQKK